MCIFLNEFPNNLKCFEFWSILRVLKCRMIMLLSCKAQVYFRYYINTTIKYFSPRKKRKIKTGICERMRGENTFVARINENTRLILSSFNLSKVIKICSVRICILFCFIELITAIILISIKIFKFFCFQSSPYIQIH